MPQEQVFHAGLEIKLGPGALTYWRQPGDAGVPPYFSFEGSENLGKAQVLYPAPSRIKEDEGEAFGYQEKVIFPVLVTPQDKSRTVTLKVKANYAVCERICIPVTAQAQLSLPVPVGSAQDRAVADAEASVPERLLAAELSEKLEIRREEAATQPSWHLQWKGAEPMTDLFSEAEAGWYFTTKKTSDKNGFLIVAEDIPSDQMTTSVSLTLTSAAHSYEFTIPLQVGQHPPVQSEKQ